MPITPLSQLLGPDDARRPRRAQQESSIGTITVSEVYLNGEPRYRVDIPTDNLGRFTLSDLGAAFGRAGDFQFMQTADMLTGFFPNELKAKEVTDSLSGPGDYSVEWVGRREDLDFTDP